VAEKNKSYSMNLLLQNTLFLDSENLSFTPCDIFIEEGKEDIRLIKTAENISSATILNCSGMIVTHAFACGHHHAYSALARGMKQPAESPKNFPEILEKIWWRLDRALDEESVYHSAKVTAALCALNGVTFCIDHHSSPSFIKGSLNIIANAFEEIGIAHLLCYEITDRNGLKDATAGLLETDEYLSGHQGLVGLHASFTVSEETLKAAVDLAKTYNSGIHIHTAEDISDQDNCIANHDKRVIQRLFDAGVLSMPKTILAHCIHIDDNERKILAAAPCTVVQNPDSNLNNRVGFHDSKLIEDKVMLGTDGMHSDMIQSAHTAYFAGAPTSPLQIYQRLRKVHSYIQQNYFKGDAANNLVVLDYPSPTEINSDNFAAHLMYAMNSSNIRHVISQGKLIVKDRELLTADIQTVMKDAQKASQKLWSKL
jgi:cytosine/adenosine deaminase-related metal-dependent hydrolase